MTSWPIDGLRRASINCFGFGGTNAHIIIDDAASYFAQRGLTGNHRSEPTSAGVLAQKQKTFPTVQIFLISSHERDGVARIAEGHAPVIASQVSDAALLPNYAYTLSRRSRLEFKTFIVADSASELSAKLANPNGLIITRSADDASTPTLVMTFCGQGAQWHAMGRELMDYEPFSNSLVGASKYLSKIVGSDFDLLQELRHTNPASSRIHEPKFAQPASTAIQIALVDLCKAANITPAAVVGHSSGEIAAAYAAGFITREDAWLIAYRRGQYATTITHRAPLLKGRMMAVGLSRAEVENYFHMVPTGTICIACENSPVSVTLSGDEDQIMKIADLLSADDVFHRILAVQTAYHSHHMQLVEADYLQSLSTIRPIANPQGPKMFSSVTGKLVDGANLNGSYWAANLVSPVLFSQAFSAMHNEIKPKVVLEVSPAATLGRPVQEILKALKSTKKKDLVSIPMLKRGHNAAVTALQALGEIWSRGIPTDLTWVWKSKEGHLPQLVVDLPPYPFNHTKSYWFESHLGTALRFRKHGREDLIGAPLAESTPQEPRWRGFFRLGENPWLLDHQVQKTTIYPAAGILTMALEAARQCSDVTRVVDAYQISDFNIIKPVIIPTGEHGLEHALSAKIIKVPSPDASQSSAVYSFSMVTRTEHGQWSENADGQFTIFYRGKAAPVEQDSSASEFHHRVYEQLRIKCTEGINPRTMYERLDGIGLNYGPLFQNIVDFSKCQSACTSVVRIPDTKSKMPAQYEYDHLIHPATLDSMFQTVFAVGDSSMVPSYIRQITLSPDMLRGAGAEFHGYAVAQRKGYREAEADIVMSDKDFSKPLVVVKGMIFVKISSDASGFLPSDRHLCSEMKWQEIGIVPPYDELKTNLVGLGPIVLLVHDDHISEGTSQLLSQLSADQAAEVEVVRVSDLQPSHMRQRCISLLEIDQATLFDVSSSVFSQIQMLLKLTPGLLWVTRGSQQDVKFPELAPFIGLARTVRSEDSSRSIVTLSLDDRNGEASNMTVSAIQSVFSKSFFNSDQGEALDYPEVEYSIRDGKFFGPRLMPLDGMNAYIEKGPDSAVQITSLPLHAIKMPIELKIGKVSEIDSTYFVPDEAAQKVLGPDDVRINVEQTHLFPIDYETLMGRSSEINIGVDVIGEVVETGSNVVDLPTGSLVVALARNTIKTSVVVHRSFVFNLPDRFVLQGASPTALTTAFHALNNVGCVSPGDTVFVSRAAGPYGDAVLRISKMLGANVLAGCLDDDDRDFIHHSYGIPMEHIVDTTKDRYPDEIMRLTAGAGVDFFFSPSPDHLELSAQCVAANGHLFLVLNTNVPASKSAVIPQHANISFHKFDLFSLIQKRPQVFAKAWAKVFGLHISGELGKCPDSLICEERVEHLDHLWRELSTAPGRHINTVTFTDNSVVRVGNNPLKPATLHSDATYVLVGGLGGLGKAIAELMVDRGARHLLFLSRSGPKTTDDQEFLTSVDQRGVKVILASVDICNLNALESVLAQNDMPPIKGAVQCAAVISDSIFEHMTYDQWASATRPKMQGSSNLARLLPKGMDFFIFLSSASGIIGNRGQGNYVAGNVYQDALARYLETAGTVGKAVSIDLGPVMGAGMLENDAETCAILKSSGFFMVMLENFLFIVERAMAKDNPASIRVPSQIITGVGTGGLIAQNNVSDPFWAETKMFEVLNKVDEPSLPLDSRSATPNSSFTSQSSQGSGRNLLLNLKNADSPEEAGEVMTRGCINYLAVSLSMDAQDMDADKSLTAYGVDSLVTSSFRSWIFKNVGVKMNDMEVIGSASIGELAMTIAEKGGWGKM